MGKKDNILETSTVVTFGKEQKGDKEMEQAVKVLEKIADMFIASLDQPTTSTDFHELSGEFAKRLSEEDIRTLELAINQIKQAKVNQDMFGKDY